MSNSVPFKTSNSDPKTEMNSKSNSKTNSDNKSENKPETKVAFIYPGQGSQFVGMGQFLYENFPKTRSVLEMASDAISVDLKKLCFSGPESELMKTENTQPAIVAVSAMAHTVLEQELEIYAHVAMGHSVGEYNAVLGAETINTEDAVKAVRHRGRSMQDAVPMGIGGMAAFMGPEPEEVLQICDWVTKNSGVGILEAANFNAPGQIVVSGHASAISWLENNLEHYPWTSAPKRTKLIPLKVSAPFHCSLMMPAQEKMADFFETVSFKTPKHKLIQNVNADYSDNAQDIRSRLISQVSQPVRWIESVLKIKNMAVTDVIEVGSGQVLKGLNKKIWPELQSFFSMNTMEDIKSLENRFQN